MKFVTPSKFTDPDVAARKLVEIANGIEAVQDGRIYIELVNEAFLEKGGTPDGEGRAARATHTPCPWRTPAALSEGICSCLIRFLSRVKRHGYRFLNQPPDSQTRAAARAFRLPRARAHHPPRVHCLLVPSQSSIIG